MNRMHVSKLLLLAMLGVATPVAASTLVLEDCELPRHEKPGRCGTLHVAEDPNRPDGRMIPINVIVIPARGQARRPDPIFYLVGGPGGGASASAAIFGDGFRAVGAKRDIVLVDVRGTGKSNPLQCAYDSPGQALSLFLEARIDPAWLADCRDGLDADPALYTTPRVVADLEAVRDALGYAQVNLVGVSYGTRVALVYLQMHPERIRTLTLRAVSPNTKLLHVDSIVSGDRTLRALLGRCAEDGTCAAAYPEIERQLQEVLGRLDREPVTVDVGYELQISREMFVGGLFLMLYDTRVAARLPFVIASAHRGSFQPFVMIAGALTGQLSGMSAGAYLSVLCAEDVPFAREADLARAAENSFLGTGYARRLAEACTVWPHGKVAKGFKKPVRSKKPVLLLSGDADPTTPPALAAETARYLPRSRQVVVEGMSHLPSWTSCFTKMLDAFLEAGSAADLDTSCNEPMPRPAFMLPPSASD